MAVVLVALLAFIAARASASFHSAHIESSYQNSIPGTPFWGHSNGPDLIRPVARVPSSIYEWRQLLIDFS